MQLTIPSRDALEGMGAAGGIQEQLQKRLRKVEKAVGRADRHPKEGDHAVDDGTPRPDALLVLYKNV